MRLQTLNGLRLEGADFHRPKPLLLLAYLAVEGAKDRRHLAELFWPNASEPATSLRVALGQLRKGAAGVLNDDTERVAFGLESDVTALLEAVREGRFESLPGLYTGAFLEGFVLPDWGAELEEWVYATREFLASQVRGSLVRLAESEAERGHFPEAANHAATAYRLRGAAPLEPDDLERLHVLLTMGNHPLTSEVQREAREFGLEFSIDSATAKKRFAQTLEITVAARSIPHNLPVSKTSFIGRDLELVEIGNALSSDDVRLITLLGPGGIGKTRLALQAAHDQLQESHFENGVFFVALENLTACDQVLRAVAAALSLKLAGKTDPLGVIHKFVAQKSILIVLDNFEQLTSEVELVSRLLEVCPNLVLIVTSRERLQLEEEFVLPISGVPIPDQGSKLADAELSDAVRLFVQRAKRARLDFALSESDLPAVLEVCRLLEGSPLGIELAAALVKLLPLPEIANEIARNLDVLETSTRNTKEGHRSLRAVFEQSWQRLSAREQGAFARMAVFQGGFTREAASEVAGATIPVLGTLVDRSLLRVNTDGRYDRHVLVHQYATEKLELMTDVQRTREKHAKCFLALAQTADPELYGANKAVWLARLALEHENLRAALDWSESQGEYELGLRLSGVLKNYWMIRGHLREGSERLEHLLKLEASSQTRVPVTVRATALTGAAWLMHAHDDFAQATLLFEESAALRQTLGETGGLEAALVNEAMLARAEGDYVRATTLLEQSLSHHRAQGNRESIGRDGIGLSLSRLALVLCEQGQYTRADALCEESLALHRTLGDRGGIAATLLAQSDIAREQGDGLRTRALAEESMKLFEDLGEEWGIAFSLNNLALAAYAQGDLEQAHSLALESVNKARTLWGAAPSAESLASLALIALARNDLEQARDALCESLSAAWKYGPRWLVAVGLEGFSWLAVGESRAERSVELLAAATALRTSIGAPLPPLRQGFFERWHHKTQAILGAELWDKCWKSGTTMPLENAVKFALELHPESSSEVERASKKVG
jgi:predicted ATPase